MRADIATLIQRMSAEELNEYEMALEERKQQLLKVENLLQSGKTYMVVFNPEAREPDAPTIHDGLGVDGVKQVLKEYGCEFDLYEAKKIASGEDHAITELK